jgi:hypothetical protein
MRPCPLIWSHRYKGVIRIANRRDAGYVRNIAPDKFVWVASAIKPFMVIEADIHDFCLHASDLRNHLATPLRVLPDNRELCDCKWARFLQKRDRYSHFSDIVQQPAQAKQPYGF